MIRLHPDQWKWMRLFLPHLIILEMFGRNCCMINNEPVGVPWTLGYCMQAVLHLWYSVKRPNDHTFTTLLGVKLKGRYSSGVVRIFRVGKHFWGKFTDTNLKIQIEFPTFRSSEIPTSLWIYRILRTRGGLRLRHWGTTLVFSNVTFIPTTPLPTPLLFSDVRSFQPPSFQEIYHKTKMSSQLVLTFLRKQHKNC